ncbi:MAG TPA: prephenate dehydratase [Solirubrobacteraceae bacterium]|nr:prephenate dehydratase [Solirubrobacteraceae bacterium]
MMSPPPEEEERRSGRARVGYLGPEGTFSEEALLAGAAAEMVEPVGLPSIYETVSALRGGTVEWALVPIENSLEGSITVTLDLLAGEARDVAIVGEELLRVRHSLIAAERVELAQIDTVLTHPQVPGQCTRFLREELGHAQVLPASSTAEAVRLVVTEPRSGRAALGTLLAAEVYGGTVIREGVEDRADNETRFAWLARGSGEQAALPPIRALDVARAKWKTSLVFWGLGAKRPGWLLRCLSAFARREINLTKIESRPRRERLGDYMFFLDLDGRIAEARVEQAIDALRELCEEVHVLGSYPAASPSPRPSA